MSFDHEALFYRDADEYVTAMIAFIRTGLALDEPTLVAVPGANLELLRDALGSDAERVRLRDMAEAGRNPGRIIPTVLLAFVGEHRGRRVRIIGEPIWAGRGEAEYRAAVQHEALINVALADAEATVLCPYDAVRLAPEAIEHAYGTHPILVEREVRRPCAGYREPVAMAAEFQAPRSVVEAAVTVPFAASELAHLRDVVGQLAERAGLASDRITDLRLAVHELAVNTIEHTGGGGTLRMWQEAGELVCEVVDEGSITDPLIGRRPLATGPARGRGLVLAHVLCDLVTIHTAPGTTAMRLHMRLGASPLLRAG